MDSFILVAPEPFSIASIRALLEADDRVRFGEWRLEATGGTSGPGMCVEDLIACSRVYLSRSLDLDEHPAGPGVAHAELVREYQKGGRTVVSMDYHHDELPGEVLGVIADSRDVLVDDGFGAVWRGDVLVSRIWDGLPWGPWGRRD